MLRRKAQRVVERSGLLHGQPRPQGARRDPRDLPARRAVPDLGGRALRDRARHPPPGRAPARAAVRPPRRVRPLPLLPRLPAARAVRHREPAARSRTSCRRRSAARASTTRRASPSRCSRASMWSSYTEQGAMPEYDVARDRGPARRGDARVDRRPPRRAARAARRGACRPALRALRRGVPRRLPRGLLRAPGGAGHRADRAARPGRRPRNEPLPAARLRRSTTSRSSWSARASRSCSPTCCRCSRTWASRSATSGRTRSRPPDRPPVWIYDFGLRHDEGAEFQADDVREIVPGRVRARLARRVENDGFNRLVLSARLTAREITILRAIAKYLRQAGSTFSQTLHGGRARRHTPTSRAGSSSSSGSGFDPRGSRTPTRKATGTRARPGAARSTRSTSLDEDRILRGFLRVVQAMLRTNYFQTDAGGQPKPYLSFKLDPDAGPGPAAPRPMFEIFVYSPRVEGVHLRGGRVARGGIRWSDRREDFRTEVLGLMKAQTVKNAVIVPVGAKGGFVVKRPAGGDRDALQRGGRRVLPDAHARPARRHRQRRRRRGRAAAATSCATTATTRTSSSPPTRARRRSPTSPTRSRPSTASGSATRSPRAAPPATTTRRWASPPAAPGSRSSATSASSAIDIESRRLHRRRHRRHVGRRVRQRRCCSRGTSGCSAPFDHRHVFLDPIPIRRRASPSASGCSSCRARRGPTTTPTLISPGGGVFPRSAKSIAALAARRARRSASRPTTLTPNELIKAILRAPVDLLWNGGIGTYVKASARDARRGRRPRQRRDPRRRRRSCAAASSARAATSASRSGPASSTRSRGGRSTRTRSTTRPASTAPTTRSTSRSCSTRSSPTAT